MKQTRSFDALGRYYTRPTISETLINLINADPRAVIDLGSGGGSLACAAGRRWKEAEITTVDIDDSAVHLGRVAAKLPTKNRHTHLVSDILRTDLPTEILDNKSFGVIVSNPPYVSAEWQKSFGEILEDAGLSVLIKQDRKVSLEILFLAQGLRLSDQGGLIALVVPDGLITGQTHKEFRRVISELYQIETVMQLPQGSFEKTQARAFIMIIAKQKQTTSKIKLLKLLPDGELCPPLLIDNASDGNRLDYDYYKSIDARFGNYTLTDLGAEIKRGSLNSAQIREIKYSKFHTNDFVIGEPLLVDLGKKIDRFARENGSILAKEGDILLARVDRALHKKVALVTSGSAVLSDCIYRIRVAPALQKSLFDYLASVNAGNHLEALARGVGARMLPKHELLKMPLRIQTCKKPMITN